MYNEYSNNDFRVLVTIFTALISVFCGILYAVTTDNDGLEAFDTFTMYCVFMSMANGLLGLAIIYPMIRFVVTFFLTFVLPVHTPYERKNYAGRCRLYICFCYRR